jgi:hypothetical protein
MVLGIGVVLLLSNRYIAQFWSTLYKRPVPTGFIYVYRYILGPVFIIICGLLALLSALLVK